MKRRRDLAGLADEELMDLVRDRRSDAFEVVYDRHGGAAYSLAHRILGDPRAAEDATQEAFLSIWRSGTAYDPTRGSVRSWIFGVVRNRAIDMVRRHSAARVPELVLNAGELLDAESGADPTDAVTLRRETAREIKGVLAELPREQSQVIELAYFGGFSHAEIAEMLQMPLGTVKGRMRLGLEKIRTSLAEGLR